MFPTKSNKNSLELLYKQATATHKFLYALLIKSELSTSLTKLIVKKNSKNLSQQNYKHKQNIFKLLSIFKFFC